MPYKFQRRKTDAFLEDVVRAYVGDDCLIWPFAKNSAGYGHIGRNGKNTLVSRIACEYANGPSPAGYEAAHECGNGHLGCCNPRHLTWKTRADNHADQIRHGTKLLGEAIPWSKLTEADVGFIRSALMGGASQQDLAFIFDVEPSNISAIHRRKSWRHVA